MTETVVLWGLGAFWLGAALWVGFVVAWDQDEKQLQEDKEPDVRS